MHEHWNSPRCSMGAMWHLEQLQDSFREPNLCSAAQRSGRSPFIVVCHCIGAPPTVCRASLSAEAPCTRWLRLAHLPVCRRTGCMPYTDVVGCTTRVCVIVSCMCVSMCVQFLCIVQHIAAHHQGQGTRSAVPATTITMAVGLALHHA